MLGSGVGTAVGLVSSGAIDRALDTQKAKKALDKEKKAQEAPQKQAEKEAKEAEKQTKTSGKQDNRTIDEVVDKHNKNTKEIMDKVDETAKKHGIETQKEKNDPLNQSNKAMDKAGISDYKRNANQNYSLKTDMQPTMTTSKSMGGALNSDAKSFFSSSNSSSGGSSSDGQSK